MNMACVEHQTNILNIHILNESMTTSNETTFDSSWLLDLDGTNITK
jgi:hypothetical protein